ncbi:ANTAR domain-containing protein [Arthrobacter jiangjiafuii]|uniref:ANTAR domain-containing protein n=1 Tax=Arthrobacter jiangjiafuii TaxID=2817475 RepID=A0A975M6K5_9MICC|nr:ANTAR domain-containing protein [Arthrobacter jiangjiafuii]MBP3043899.1 ANTAR domain-containing protein [Arthrobacter jiangjiafuii]QWC10906.1 ANTAR domain-containing protein [Arthrobacter jiangjiafuii]
MVESTQTELSPARLQVLLLAHPDLDGFLQALAAYLSEHLAPVLGSSAPAGCSLRIVRPRRQPVQVGDGHVHQMPDMAAASVPVPGVEPAIAVLSCFRSRPGPLGAEDVRAVELAAAGIAPALALALRLDGQAHRANNLQAAMESRTVVDLAAGIIMGQNNCSQDRAVEILRSVSNSRNVKIRDVAAGVVAVVTDRVSTHFEE